MPVQPMKSIGIETISNPSGWGLKKNHPKHEKAKVKDSYSEKKRLVYCEVPSHWGLFLKKMMRAEIKGNVKSRSLWCGEKFREVHYWWYASRAESYVGEKFFDLELQSKLDYVIFIASKEGESVKENIVRRAAYFVRENILDISTSFFLSTESCWVLHLHSRWIVSNVLIKVQSHKWGNQVYIK